MSNNEITVLPINLLQSFIDSNENAIKMFNELIDNTIERQYILISDSLNLLDNSRRSARQLNTPSYLGRSVSSLNRANRYYRRQIYLSNFLRHLNPVFSKCLDLLP